MEVGYSKSDYGALRRIVILLAKEISETIELKFQSKPATVEEKVEPSTAPINLLILI